MIRIITPDWHERSNFKRKEHIIFVYYSSPNKYQQIEHGHIGHGNYKIEQLDGIVRRLQQDDD